MEMVELTAQVPSNLRTQLWQLLGDALDVLVTATRHADNNVLVLIHRLG